MRQKGAALGPLGIELMLICTLVYTPELRFSSNAGLWKKWDLFIHLTEYTHTHQDQHTHIHTLKFWPLTRKIKTKTDKCWCERAEGRKSSSLAANKPGSGKKKNRVAATPLADEQVSAGTCLSLFIVFLVYMSQRVANTQGHMSCHVVMMSHGSCVKAVASWEAPILLHHHQQQPSFPWLSKTNTLATGAPIPPTTNRNCRGRSGRDFSEMWWQQAKWRAAGGLDAIGPFSQILMSPL